MGGEPGTTLNTAAYFAWTGTCSVTDVEVVFDSVVCSKNVNVIASLFFKKFFGGGFNFTT